MRKIKAADVVQDLSIYPRCAVDKGHVQTLAHVIDAGGELPPLVICSRTRKLIDGFHRLNAAIQVFGFDCDVEVLERNYATPAEMWLDAIRYNAKHGLPFSGADRERCKLTCRKMGIEGKAVAQALGIRESALGVLTAAVRRPELKTLPASRPAQQESRLPLLIPAEQKHAPRVVRTTVGPPPEPLNHGWLPEVSAHDPCINGMPAADAAAVANRVMLHLYRGSIEQARDALEDGWRSHVKEQQPLPYGPDLLEEPLARVIDDVLLLNALEEYGIDTIGELLGVSDAELLAIPNFGNARLAKLRNIAVGLRMRAELDRDDEESESDLQEAVA